MMVVEAPKRVFTVCAHLPLCMTLHTGGRIRGVNESIMCRRAAV